MRQKLSAEEYLAAEKAIYEAYRKRLREGGEAGIDRDTATARLRALGIPQWQIDKDLAKIRR